MEKQICQTLPLIHHRQTVLHHFSLRRRCHANRTRRLPTAQTRSLPRNSFLQINPSHSMETATKNQLLRMSGVQISPRPHQKVQILVGHQIRCCPHENRLQSFRPKMRLNQNVKTQNHPLNRWVKILFHPFPAKRSWHQRRKQVKQNHSQPRKVCRPIVLQNVQSPRSPDTISLFRLRCASSKN